MPDPLEFDIFHGDFADARSQLATPMGTQEIRLRVDTDEWDGGGKWVFVECLDDPTMGKQLSRIRGEPRKRKACDCDRGAKVGRSQRGERFGPMNAAVVLYVTTRNDSTLAVANDMNFFETVSI